mmetsp:Transcript_52113/g.102033  ORF Transcript_52113/g.102033 Transcript_52113/m.102033 type:complete len:104 (+) Transcript_52113:1032-1343(+)
MTDDITPACLCVHIAESRKAALETFKMTDFAFDDTSVYSPISYFRNDGCPSHVHGATRVPSPTFFLCFPRKRVFLAAWCRHFRRQTDRWIHRQAEGMTGREIH